MDLIYVIKQHHHDRFCNIAYELILTDVAETVKVQYRRVVADVGEVEAYVLPYFVGIALGAALAERFVSAGQHQQVADQSVAHVLDGSLYAHTQNL